MAVYYEDLQTELEQLFGTQVIVKSDQITIGKEIYPVEDDVIILDKINAEERDKNRVIESFGREWERFSDRKAEHDKDFDNYFDLVDLSALQGTRCADLGCGMGRWSQILLEKVDVRLLVMIDYSDAIFVARKNMRHRRNVIFIKADLETLSLSSDFFDFSLCLGVLHHIPGGVKTAAENIARISKKHLCYLYYNFDNRGIVFRTVFKTSNIMRRVLSSINQEWIRITLSHLLTVIAYYPFILAAALVDFLGRNNENVPLNYYVGYSYNRIRQDAYDRFFTPVEYRFNQGHIIEIFQPLYAQVTISEKPPFWHFLCEKATRGS